jgi:predicted ATPase
MKVISFRATNFRGFVDTGHIKLKPINLLVGKNSIGKSSYARLWPIFNQGSKIQKRSPIIWNGTLVDFGSFGNVLSRHASTKKVGFEFKMSTEINDTSSKNANLKFARRAKHLSRSIVTLRIELVEGSDGLSTHCQEFGIELHGITVQYIFNEKGSIVDVVYQNESNKIAANYTQERNVGFLIPVMDFFIRTEEKLYPTWFPIRTRLFRFLRGLLHQRLADERVIEICEKLNVVGTKDELLEYCESLPYVYKTWRDFLGNLQRNDELFEKFYKYVMLASSELLIRDMDADLRRHFSSVNYIRPLRATAQRYYRRQELAVDNIDSEGANLAFYLASLSEDQIDDLNLWLANTIEINVKLDGEHGHLMVILTDLTTGREDNMADMGFGFSQVLPLAVQAWISSAPAATTPGQVVGRNIILVWEQPELHLHPAMQRKLTRLIAKTIEVDVKKRISFVIETHSQSMINEFGDLIMNDSKLNKNIQVLLFEQKDSPETKISTTSYDEEGQLLNWPRGFLTV